MTATVEVVVGVVGRAHGIRGEVGVDPRTDEPELRFAPAIRLRVEDQERTLEVSGHRWHSGRLLVRFAGIDDRTAAEALRGVRLVADVPAGASPAEPDSYYDRQLVGLTALDAAGETVGPVVGVVHRPAQDLLEIDTGAGVRLVPFVSALVPVVDLAAGTVQLADVAGLLHDEAGESDEDDQPDESAGPA